MQTAQDRYNVSPKGRLRVARFDASHRNERALAARQRYAENPKKHYAAVRASLQRKPIMRLLQVARRRAKLKELEFSITADDFSRLPTHCPIFGVELRYGGKGYHPDAASIDRRDNSEGYTQGNAVIVSRRANVVKSSGTAAEHRAIAAWMESVGGDNGT